MRFMHLADLHIGKKVNGFSMLEDQRYILEQVLEIAGQRDLNGVILAGDIYDKSVPAGEAVQLLDWLLTELADMGLAVYMVSGNHDSVERLSFGSKILAKSDVHVASVYDGCLEKIVLQDEFGPLNLYLLPFVKPVHVRKAIQEQEDESSDIKTYDEAIAAVLARAKVDASERNLLVAHQLVTGAARCDSEDISIGGLDNISAELFVDFDYVALGHIHGPQHMTRDSIRYAGTLLKYSFSESAHEKSITVVELKGKGEVIIETIPVNPLRDMRVIEGDYKTIMSKPFYEGTNQEDYLKVVLTDQQEIPDVMGKLRTVYPYVMTLEYSHLRKKRLVGQQEEDSVKEKHPMDYFKEFYLLQNDEELNEKQEEIVLDLMKRIWGD